MGMFGKGVAYLKSKGVKGFVKKVINKFFKVRQYKKMKDFHDLEIYFHDKNGIEIGGPSGFFNKKGFMPVYRIMKSLDGVNFSSSTVWTGAIDEKKGFIIDGKLVGKQYILDAVDLTPIKNNSYDFVLSCNNIEHIANPLKAVEQWLTVLKKGGIIVIVAPRKEGNFDHNRETVKFDHLMTDYQNKIKEDDLTHLEEILACHDLEMDPPSGTIEQFKERSLKNIENRCLHQHVFDLDVLEKICKYFNLSVIKSIPLLNDYVIVGQK